MQERIESLKKYHRLTNYLSVAMLYLKDNFFLEKELTHDHIKNRILGHWGTVPGLNLIYGGVSNLIKEKIAEDKSVMFITGPGHGAPAILSGLFLEESLKEFYPQATLDKNGMAYLIKQFSWPGGFPSHTYPGLPGQIHEGGELGYSLGTAYGAVLDNPNLIVACVVGDGEAETATISASWQSNKFLNPKKDGIVLPILHLNGYKISGPTVFSAMNDDEIKSYFWGLGYDPIIVDQYVEKDNIYNKWIEQLDYSHYLIERYRNEGTNPPIIILKTYKGWTGPLYKHEEKVEDNNLAHGIPFKDPKKDEYELNVIKDWLNSYNIHEIIDIDGIPNAEITNLFPSKVKRLGFNRESMNYGQINPLVLPDLNNHEEKFENRGQHPESGMEEAANYLKAIVENNLEHKNFRIFSPDESESNMLETLFDVTCRVCNRNFRDHDKFYSDDGRMMEILSENVLQTWMEGYIKTGRQGFLISYEAFLGIVSSQIHQYLKYLKQASKFAWRSDLPSLNYIASSTGWRQDHNGFSHQNPSLINTLVSNQNDNTSVYFPADVNTLLVTMEDCLKRTNAINLIISGKRDLPQWLTIEEAREHVKNGVSIWDWASNLSNIGEVDVVLVSAGDYQTKETLAAAKILKEELPELKFQYVNVNEITRLGLGDESMPLMIAEDFNKYFTKDRPVIFSFHGYPDVVKQLTWGTSLSNRMTILGYIEEGTTTTPFDMQVQNKTSRYHICSQAVIAASRVNEVVNDRAEALVRKWNNILEKHQEHIVEYGDDVPEVKNFDYSF